MTGMASARPFKQVTPLFPSVDDRARWDNYLTAVLAGSLSRVSQGPVAPQMDLLEIQKELEGFDFREPVEFETLLAWVTAQLESGLVHMTHPRYLGLFNPGASFPSQCADRIAAAFNPQLASATTSPAAIEIESHTIRTIAERAGLGKQTGGHFTSGGSEANYTALICALTSANSMFADIGSRAFAGQPVFYISKDAHLAWIKLAHQAGIGRNAVRQVQTDGIGRMSIEALTKMIDADRAGGHIPFMVAATAGTTNAGMVDPLDACAGIAREAGLWYHVDAAWGGALIASRRFQGLIAGIEFADSVTIDAHKWFATTMGCGIFLTKNQPILSATFNVPASFMPSAAPARDPYMTTAQWSRRFAGLRLFMSLAAGGWAEHGAHVERCISLARLFSEGMQDHGWSVVNWPALAVACVEPPVGGARVNDIVGYVVASGRAWVSAARFEGRDVVRACVVNGETAPADILEVVHALEQARQAMERRQISLC